MHVPVQKMRNLLLLNLAGSAVHPSRTALTAAMAAMLALSACDAESSAPAHAAVDAASAAGADAAAADATTDEADGTEPNKEPFIGWTCRYTNPFSQGEECKAYTGSGWDLAAAQADCAAPVPGAEGTFAESDSCAAEAALGSCTVAGTEGKGYELVSAGSNPDDCSLAQLGCEIFAKGQFSPAYTCAGQTGGGDGTDSEDPLEGSVFVQAYVSCKDPLPGEPPGKGPNGQVCANVLVSGATEFGRRYQDYASCADVRTQRPYWAAKPNKVTAADDPRWQDSAYLAEVEWARQQLLSTACVCCHAKSVAPKGASNWDLEGEGIWLDHLRDGGLAMMAGLAKSDALGAYPADQNHGYDRTALGTPTTDVERMRKLLLGEWARRGLTPDDAAKVPPFGGPLVVQQNFKPGACSKGEGVDASGKVTWQGGAARYVYVMQQDSQPPVVPPNLDEPAGTLWFVDVPTAAKPMASGLQWGQLTEPMRQRLPKSGAPAALTSGQTYYLYVLADIGIPITRCLFTAP